MKKLLLVSVLLVGLSFFSANAQKEAPKDAKYYYKHGMEQSDLNKVIADFTKAIELEPGFLDAYFYRGIARLNNKMETEALSDFNKIISMNPNNADVYHYRGQTYEKLGKPADALKDYNKATLLNPKLGDAFYRKGKLLNGQGASKGCPDIKKAAKLGYKVPAADLTACP